MNYEKMVREICNEIGLDIYEINLGYDFEGTVRHYTRIAKEDQMTYEELRLTLEKSMYDDLFFNELKSNLLDKQFNFIDFDNLMMYKGFLTVFDDGVTEHIKNDLNVVYTPKEDGCEVHIFFEIISDNEECECEENFNMKVISVEKF